MLSLHKTNIFNPILILKQSNIIMAKTENNSPTQAELSKIAAMRQILFGENMVEYDKEFDKIQDSIKKVEQNLAKQIQELKKELTAKDEALAKEKTSRKQLANLLIEMAQSLEK